MCSPAAQQAYNAYLSDMSAWRTENMPRYEALNTKISNFQQNVTARLKEEQFTVNEYTVTQHTPVVTASRPGEIMAGGNLTINGNLTNDKSRIMAGANLAVNGNVNTIDAKGASYTEHHGMSGWTTVKNGSLGGSSRKWQYAPIDMTTPATQVPLGVASIQGNTTISGNGNQAGALHTNITSPNIARPNLTLPNSSLYILNPGFGKNYLIETDPRFTNKGQWLTSDYMLSALGLDPARTQKRLGDGFYEQKLIREQVGSLTGYRFLAVYQSDEDQYKALMNAGVEFAKKYQLTVGVALTLEQMQHLTSDIIWLISQDVTLPDGQTQTVLVPQLYTRSGTNMITADGALMSANNVIIQGQQNKHITVNNNATLAAKQGLFIDAAYLNNQLGQIHGNNILVASASDIDNTGTIYLSGDGQQTTNASNNKQIQIQAGRDINLNAAYIANNASQAASASDKKERPATTLVAGGNIELGTVTTSQSHNTIFDPKNWQTQGSSQEIGSTLASQSGDINLIANNHIGIRAGTLQSEQGNINASSNTLTIEAGNASYNEGQATYKKTTGTLSAQSKTNVNTSTDSTLVASTLSAQAINLVTQKDLTIQASDVVATDDVNLISQEGHINITAGAAKKDTYSYEKTKKSGVMGGSGTGSFSIGKQQTTTTETGHNTYAQGATVGSLQGNINISAQQGNYNQTGSDLLALQGDINVVAQDINIQEARETGRKETPYEFKQSGLTIGVSSPLLSMVQTAQQMADASGKTDNSRMKALAAGAAALNVYNNMGQLDNMGKQLADGNLFGKTETVNGEQQTTPGGMGLSIGLGSSKAQSRTVEESNSAKGSSLNAGGNINLVATGKPGQDPNKNIGGNITLQGSTLTAKNNANLIANDQINILAAANTTNQKSTSKSSSGSIGVTLGAGWSVNAGVSGSKGKGEANSTEWTQSHVNSGNTTTLISGGNTNIIGSQVAGNKVIANIGGDLNIQSLQD